MYQNIIEKFENVYTFQNFPEVINIGEIQGCSQSERACVSLSQAQTEPSVIRHQLSRLDGERHGRRCLSVSAFE